MTAVYTYSEARQNLASLLDQAQREGEVSIKRKDGGLFVIRPAEQKTSPLNVEGLNLGVSTEEIIDFVRESRERKQ